MAAFKGQMELYLRYLQKYEMVEGENLPVGLILCSGKNEEHIELLQLDKSNIRVADYLTQLPPRKSFGPNSINRLKSPETDYSGSSLNLYGWPEPVAAPADYNRV